MKPLPDTKKENHKIISPFLNNNNIIFFSAKRYHEIK